MSRRWLRSLLGLLVGAGLGVATYLLIGCSTGACPITSNPWITTAYGAVAGLVIAQG